MIRIGMSTSCVFPKPLEYAFRTARETGYDGVEIMVTSEQATRSAESISGMMRRYELPVLAIHAPVLFFTQFVWGTDQRGKLQRSAELAAAVGAPTVVVHPPFRWQAGYAERFLDIVQEIAAATGVEIAIENMFPWRVSGKPLRAYMPGIDPVEMDCDAITLDFSHAGLAGADALQMARAAGTRLRHVHLCDGGAPASPDAPELAGRILDEHLIPGQGGQPVAETLRYLAANDWSGGIAAEINTRKARGEEGRAQMLRETLAFAREHLAHSAAA